MGVTRASGANIARSYGPQNLPPSSSVRVARSVASESEAAGSVYGSVPASRAQSRSGRVSGPGSRAGDDPSSVYSGYRGGGGGADLDTISV